MFLILLYKYTHLTERKKNKVCFSILNILSYIICLRDVFIMIIQVKMSTVVGILTFMRMINFVLGWIEREKGFITSGLVWVNKSIVSRK